MGKATVTLTTANVMATSGNMAGYIDNARYKVDYVLEAGIAPHITSITCNGTLVTGTGLTRTITLPAISGMQFNVSLGTVFHFQ